MKPLSPRDRVDDELALIAELASLRRSCPIEVDVRERVLLRVRTLPPRESPLFSRAGGAALTVLFLVLTLLSGASLALWTTDEPVLDIAATATNTGGTVMGAILAPALALLSSALGVLFQKLRELFGVAHSVLPLLEPLSFLAFGLAAAIASILAIRALRDAPPAA